MEHKETYEEAQARVLLETVRQLGGSDELLLKASAEIQRLLRGEPALPARMEPEDYYQLEGLLKKLRDKKVLKAGLATEPYLLEEVISLSWDTVLYLEQLTGLLRLAPKGAELEEIYQEWNQGPWALLGGCMDYLELSTGRLLETAKEVSKATGLSLETAQKTLEGSRKARLLKRMVATLNNGGSYQDLLALAQGQQLSEEQSRLIIRSALADTFDWFQFASAAEDPGLRAIALDIMAPYTEILETYQDTITGEVWNR
jgi:hypothetical protein